MGRNPAPEKDVSTVYARYSDMLYRIALMHAGNENDAMDCVQDVFLKYMDKNIIHFSEEHEKAWFIRATVNRCHDLYRKNSIRSHDELSAAENVSYREHFSEDTYQLSEALEHLPEKIKTVIILHYLEGYSAEETAKILRLTVSAVKMRLKRGREELKSLLEEEFNV